MGYFDDDYSYDERDDMFYDAPYEKDLYKPNDYYSKKEKPKKIGSVFKFVFKKIRTEYNIRNNIRKIKRENKAYLREKGIL